MFQALCGLARPNPQKRPEIEESILDSVGNCRTPETRRRGTTWGSADDAIRASVCIPRLSRSRSFGEAEKGLSLSSRSDRPTSLFLLTNALECAILRPIPAECHSTPLLAAPSLGLISTTLTLRPRGISQVTISVRRGCGLSIRYCDCSSSQRRTETKRNV